MPSSDRLRGLEETHNLFLSFESKIEFLKISSEFLKSVYPTIFVVEENLALSLTVSMYAEGKAIFTA